MQNISVSHLSNRLQSKPVVKNRVKQISSYLGGCYALRMPKSAALRFMTVAPHRAAL